MSFWQALINHGFLQHALAASLLASVACGVVGAFVVLKRIAFLAGGIAHGVLVGMAAGLIMIAKAPGQNPDLMSYLFGNVLMVGREQLWLMLALDIVILAAVAGLYPTMVATAFDEEFARLRGQPVELARLFILILVALTVVLLIQVVGLILVIALLTLPAAMAWNSASVGAMMARASGWAALAGVAGLWAAYQFDWPAGPTMVLTTGSLYMLNSLGMVPSRKD